MDGVTDAIKPGDLVRTKPSVPMIVEKVTDDWALCSWIDAEGDQCRAKVWVGGLDVMKPPGCSILGFVDAGCMTISRAAELLPDETKDALGLR